MREKFSFRHDLVSGDMPEWKLALTLAGAILLIAAAAAGFTVLYYIIVRVRAAGPFSGLAPAVIVVGGGIAALIAHAKRRKGKDPFGD